jgi:hypothetical protein
LGEFCYDFCRGAKITFVVSEKKYMTGSGSVWLARTSDGSLRIFESNEAPTHVLGHEFGHLDQYLQGCAASPSGSPPLECYATACSLNKKRYNRLVGASMDSALAACTPIIERAGIAPPARNGEGDVREDYKNLKDLVESLEKDGEEKEKEVAKQLRPYLAGMDAFFLAWGEEPAELGNVVPKFAGEIQSYEDESELSREIEYSEGVHVKEIMEAAKDSPEDSPEKFRFLAFESKNPGTQKAFTAKIWDSVLNSGCVLAKAAYSFDLKVYDMIRALDSVGRGVFDEMMVQLLHSTGIKMEDLPLIDA